MEIAAVGATMWAVITKLQLNAISAKTYEHPDRGARIMLGQATALPIVIAGLSLAAGYGGGLYWLVPGVAMGLIGGIANTWVLLIEILR